MTKAQTDRLLRAKCICGKYGRGLSFCKHCGGFIGMTLVASRGPRKKASKWKTP